MAQAGQIVADTLLLLKEHAQPGITTRSSMTLAEEFIAQPGRHVELPGGQLRRRGVHVDQ